MWDLIVSVPDHCLSFYFFYVGAIIESDAQPTGVQLKREAKLLTVTGLNTLSHNIYVISNRFVTYDIFF